MKVLILSGSFGMGHNSTAQSIKEDMEKKYTETEIKILDIIDYCFPKTSNLIYNSFKLLVKKCPNLYNFSYKLSERRKDVHLERFLLKKLNTMMDKYSPDVIISTIPFAADNISYYKEKKNISIPHITCITDISIHPEWVTKNSDMYFVGSEDTKEYLCKSGINKDKIHITGIPVKSAFKIDNTVSIPKLKARKKVLIMGGGFGLIPFHDEILSKLNTLPGIETTIITGQNKKLHSEISKKYSNINVIGYTNEVYNYMKSSDILISKPGGITLFEAIQSTLPILVVDPFLAQEKHNAHYIEDMEIGKVIWNKHSDIFSQVYNFIYDDQLQIKIQERMHNIKSQINKVEMVTLIEELYERQAV